MRKLSQINESLWSKGIERSKYGNVRRENATNLDIVCESVGKMMAEVMNIPYTPDLCKNRPSEMGRSRWYVVYDFSTVDESFSEISAQVYPPDEYLTIEKIYDEILGTFSSIRIRDEIKQSPHFNKLNDVIKQINVKLKKHIPIYNKTEK